MSREAETLPPQTPPEGEKPPRGVKTMGVVRWLMVGLSVVAAGWTWSSFVIGQQPSVTAASAANKTKYHCPMHPQIISDEPGECPICHMQLEPFAPPLPAAPAQASTPAGASASAPAQGDPHPGHAMPASPGPQATADAGATSEVPPGSRPPGTTPVTLSFDRVQSIGMRTSIASVRDAGGALRVTAIVAASEQGASEVHVRTGGFVQYISVRETGVPVKAGQDLLGIYSPDIFQAQNELLAAASFGDAGARSVAGARQKLELLGMAPRAIEGVVTSGKAVRVISVSAPAGGFVTKKSVVLGSYVTPEMALYEITDLSRVYVIAEVFQRDIGRVRVGTEGRFVLASAPTTSATAKIDLIYPQVNADARTTRVRMQIANDKLGLRPGQYGDVELEGATHKVVLVPRDAVVDTGRFAYVFVDEGSGRYTPRAVLTGKESGEEIEIREGIAGGERVVSSATFLVDSESRLQASLAQATSSPTPTACDASFDRERYPEKWGECRSCEKQHAGMGAMVDDCKNAIPRPWR